MFLKPSPPNLEAVEEGAVAVVRVPAPAVPVRVPAPAAGGDLRAVQFVAYQA